MGNKDYKGRAKSGFWRKSAVFRRDTAIGRRRKGLGVAACWEKTPSVGVALEGGGQRPTKSLRRRRAPLSARVRSISLAPAMNTTPVQAANSSQPGKPG